jgi:hypothetical protein
MRLANVVNLIMLKEILQKREKLNKNYEMISLINE